jgi:hypothetical protein
MRHLLKLKCAHSPLNLRILSSTSVPFTLTTVQVLNLALTLAERITVRRQIFTPILLALLILVANNGNNYQTVDNLNELEKKIIFMLILLPKSVQKKS